MSVKRLETSFPQPSNPLISLGPAGETKMAKSLILLAYPITRGKHESD